MEVKFNLDDTQVMIWVIRKSDSSDGVVIKATERELYCDIIPAYYECLGRYIG